MTVVPKAAQAPVDNPPGLNAVAYRVGTQPRFLASMLAALSDPEHPALHSLTTRRTDDPAIGLLDAWACVCDVLTFYTERLAQEGFLRTATEHRSIVELARLVGYAPRPGVAASAMLAFTLDVDPLRDRQTVIPKGTAARSVPGAGELPQTFETSADLPARYSYNKLPPRTEAADLITPEIVELLPSVYVSGLANGVGRGDWLAFVFGGGVIRPMIVTEVEPLPALQRTRLGLRAPAGLAPAAHLPAESATLESLRVLRLAVPPLGATVAGTPPDWSSQAATGELYLDSVHPGLVPGDIVVIDQGSITSTHVIEGVTASVFAQGNFAARATKLSLGVDWRGPETDFPTILRLTTVRTKSETLKLAARPVTEPIGGSVIELAGVFGDLRPGQLLLVSGADSVELAVVAKGKPQQAGAPDAYTTVTLEQPLTHTYDLDKVTIYGNVVVATLGESRQAVLGSGDASVANQSFALRGTPLTYIPSADPSGVSSTLHLTVDGVEWHQTASLAELGPADRGYTTRTADDGTVTVIGGDGVHGARFPTGRENISAAYRLGVGAAGNVDAGKISQLATRPLGVRDVVNPQPATGGADPDQAEFARPRIPLGTFALDRVVSLADYADFARSRPGIGKAIARRLAGPQRPLIHVTVCGTEADKPLEDGSALILATQQALSQYGDPNLVVRVQPGFVRELELTVRIKVLPGYQFSLVDPAVRQALVAALGFDRRDLTQPVYQSEVIAAIQAVRGVDYLELDLFATAELPDELIPVPPVPYLRAAPAFAGADGATLPAELIVAVDNPALVKLQELP